MAKQQLSLESLSVIDNGKINAAFDFELKKIIEDCHDRPAMDKKPRKLLLEVVIIPNTGTDRDQVYCESLSMQVNVCSKIPGRRTKTYTMDSKPTGQAFFNANSPENPDQMTIDDLNLDKGTGEVLSKDDLKIDRIDKAD